jgi:hypothetical protein
MRPHVIGRTVVAAACAGVLVIALAGCGSAASPVETGGPSTASAIPTPAVAPTPAADVVQPPEGGWVAFDRVLVGGGIFAYGSQREVLQPGTPSVFIYVPGDGPHTVALSANLGVGEIKRQLMNVTGPDGDLMLVIASTILIPSEGLTAQSVDSRLDSYSISSGDHIATYDLGKSDDTSQTVSAIGASRSDVVGADLASSNGGVGSPVGVNMRSGQKVWAGGPHTALGEAAIAGTSSGTLVLETVSSEKDPFGSRCVREEGIDTVTGKSLWTVDSTKIPDPSSPKNCSVVRLITMDSDGGGDSYSSFGEFFAVNISVTGYNKKDKCRSFDGATGAMYAYNACTGTWRYDPLNKLVVDNAGNINDPVVVYDLVSGKVVYTVTAKQRNSLDLSVQGLIGGYLYTKTSDGTPIVDVATGKVVANETINAPALTVGGYTLYSDGTITTDSHLAAGAN